jgi:hypothetical protein
VGEGHVSWIVKEELGKLTAWNTVVAEKQTVAQKITHHWTFS